ncbi:MAG: hypothetical protein NC489_27390 [Ruminococcus flavefaciens]|nr:hypothetical protein [Ruminococcus flavefaciens]
MEENNQNLGGYPNGQPQNGPTYGQPNGGYQQQPYGYPPQQPYYAPPPPVAVPASPAEKTAAFNSGGSVLMLILCIVSTINLGTILLDDILSFNISGLLLYILDILIIVGTWMTYACSRKNKLTSTGISLIRIPYIIQFVFSVLTFVGNIPFWVFTFNIISFFINTITFIFECICFASVNKTLSVAQDINNNKTVAGRRASIFAAVSMIIFATLRLVKEIVGYLIVNTIKAAVSESKILSFLVSLVLGGGGTATLVVAGVTFAFGILGAVVILIFAKKLKQAHGEN